MWITIFFEKIVLLFFWSLILFLSKYIINTVIFVFFINLVIIFIKIIYGKIIKQSIIICYPSALKHDSLNVEWINLIFWRPQQLAFLSVYILKKKWDGEKIKISYKTIFWIIFTWITGVGRFIFNLFLIFIKAFLTTKKNSYHVLREEIFLLFFYNDNLLANLRILVIKGVIFLNPPFFKQLTEKYSSHKLKQALAIIKESGELQKIVSIQGRTPNGIMKTHPGIINGEEFGLTFTHHYHHSFYNTNLDKNNPIYAAFIKNIDGKITEGSKYFQYTPNNCNWMFNQACAYYLNGGIFPTYYTYFNSKSLLIIHNKNDVPIRYIYWSAQQLNLYKKLIDLEIDNSDINILFTNADLLYTLYL